jgi:hypothetical protein
MPRFEDLDITFRLDSIAVDVHADRWFGVEPYVIPVFFKIDGEGYNAFLRFFNTQPPEPGTTQVVETSEVQLQLLSLRDDGQPLIEVPPGPILRGVEVSSGETLDVSDIAVETSLQPVPLVIDVLGLFDLEDILNGLSDFVIQTVLEGLDVDVLNLVSENVSEVVARLLGLDEELDVCPPADLDPSELINAVEAEFNALIPGTVGGVFAVMENDDFDEDDAVTIQGSIHDLVAQTVEDITNSVTRVNPIPDFGEEDVDRDAVFWEIAGDLFLRLDPGFWFITLVGWMWAALDEPIGVMTPRFDHEALESGDQDFSETLTGADNTWTVSGIVEVG